MEQLNSNLNGRRIPAGTAQTKPAVIKPATGKNTTAESATVNNTAAKPATERHIEAEPVTEKPASEKPEMGKHIATKPAMAKPAAKKTAVREYVKVSSDFDRTGYMQPRTITWGDGRVFKIESVKDYYPLQSASGCCTRDCYTVIIRGEERYLFFERASELAAGRVGRWYVQVNQ